MPEVIIREAEAGDVKAIAELEPICFNDPWSEEMIYDDVVKNNISVYVVAEVVENDRSVIGGYTGIWVVGGECQINNVAVAPEYRRMGLASEMLGAVIDTCETYGVGLFTLEVRKSNIPGIELYRSLGFREVGIRKNYYQDNGEDAILMNRGTVEK